jgi:Terpene synthase family 2, C-terminal metal binding
MSHSHSPLACPFPAAINPHAVAVEHATIAWTRQVGLIQCAADAQRLQQLQYAMLMARAYPHAALSALQLISDWNTWLFLLDDQCDAAALGRSPEQLAQFHTSLLDILRGESPKQDSPLICALHDLATRLRAHADAACLERFTQQIAEYFTANIWEATNRAQRQIPDVETYLMMRPYTGAVYSYLVLIEFAGQLDLPPMVHAHPTVQQLAQMTNNIICWSNDLMSLERELRHGDVHNLVLILHHAQRRSLPEAIRRVAAMHDAEVQRFRALAADLPSFTAAVDADLQQYVTGMQFWMRANMDWSAATARYRSHS